VGPGSIAGLNGPDLREFQPGVMPGNGEGEVMFATGGRIVLPGVSIEGLPNDCSNTFGSRLNGL